MKSFIATSAALVAMASMAAAFPALEISPSRNLPDSRTTPATPATVLGPPLLGSVSPQRFQVLVTDTTNDLLDNYVIQANGGSFWVGKVRDVNCQLPDGCPDLTANDRSTQFFLNGTALEVNVPAGPAPVVQIAKNGALVYRDVVGEQLGFVAVHHGTSRAVSRTDGSPSLLQMANGINFFACPTNPENRGFPYQIFAEFQDNPTQRDFSSCAAFVAVTQDIN